jgi:hypothetical protein
MTNINMEVVDLGMENWKPVSKEELPERLTEIHQYVSNQSDNFGVAMRLNWLIDTVEHLYAGNEKLKK